MLNLSTDSRVVVESASQEFSRELTFLDLFGERRIMDSGSWGWVVRQLGLHDPLLNQLVEDMEIGKLVLGIVLHLYRVILESCDLSLVCSLGHLMPHAHEWHSYSQKPHAPDRDLIGLAVPLYALSCQ